MSEVETQGSTIDYYHEKRQELLDELGGQCEWDGCQRTDPEALQFHHENAVGNTERGGGWGHLYQIREELDNGEEIKLLCQEHHAQEHAERSDLEPLTRWEG